VSWSLIVRSEAETDLSEAYAWYDSKSTGLGEEFLLRVEAAFDSIRYNPLMNSCIYKEARRKVLRRFPFCVFYTIHQTTIFILAVIHAKRNPQHWKGRI